MNPTQVGSFVRELSKIRPEPGEPRHARVIGELTGEAVDILLAGVECGLTVLDLSEVDRVDDRAVRALARLRPERCALSLCRGGSSCGSRKQAEPQGRQQAAACLRRSEELEGFKKAYDACMEATSYVAK